MTARLLAYDCFFLQICLRLSMALSPWKALSSYKWLFILLISANIAITSACHTEVSQQKQVAKYPVVPCRVIQHMAGETCVPYRSKRIATLYTPALANVLALGIKPIAITQATGTFEAFPPYLKDEVNGIELVATAGDVINLEKLLNLKPDLILGWDHHISVYPLLSRISPTLLPQSSVEASGENWKEYLRFLAEALEKQDAAQQILSNYDQRIEDLKVALGNRYSNKTISVAHISREYGVEAYVKNSFAGSILFNAGLKRPNSQDIIALPRGTIEAISIES
ncbi:iron-siderophore ABC transporter substrate-binding protein [bacterium]|nr:iron-siderophore ABC transporter substrate-binding protein [bacterium]